MSNRDKRSFCLGIALRLMQNRLPLSPSRKEPVAFLYNGVRLPPLPEWDRTVYPYVIATSRDDIFAPGEKLYGLTFFDKPCAWEAYTGGKWLEIRGNIAFCYCTFSQLAYEKDRNDEYSLGELLGLNQWGAITPHTADRVTFSVLEVIFWANTNIPAEDGTILVAASEPIPVYE